MTSSFRGGKCPPGGLPGWYGGIASWPSANTSRHSKAVGGHPQDHTSDASASAQRSEVRTRAWWPPRDTTSRCCGTVAES